MKALLRLLPSVLFVLGAAPASAVLIATSTPNTSAPPDDPGWAHMGTRTGTNDGGSPLNGLTLIYLGNGWVMTAAHVQESDLLLGGQTYPRVSGSTVRLLNEDDSPADLIVFQVSGDPDLPLLPILEIASTSPPIGASLLLIGRGRNRGGSTTWFQPPSGPLREGWDWAPGAKMRWGSNVVADPILGQDTGTDSFLTDFTKPGDPGFTSEEAQVVVGDSGAAVFYKPALQWLLAGVAHSAEQHPGQPAQTSLDGNLSYAADLAVFRDQLIPIVRPQCSDEIDNDGDGNVDFPDDPQCLSREADNEAAHLPALSPLSLGALVLIMGLAGIARPGFRAAGASCS